MTSLTERTFEVLRGPVTAAARRTVPCQIKWEAAPGRPMPVALHPSGCTCGGTGTLLASSGAPFRALVDGIEGSEGEVCPCDPFTGGCQACGVLMEHTSECLKCHGTGRIGARQALPGLLRPCEHDDLNPIDTGMFCSRCKVTISFDDYQHLNTEDLEQRFVLAPLLRQALEAGEYGAAIGQVRQRVYGIHTSINGIPTDPTKKGYEALLNAIERAAQEVTP